LVHDLLFGLFIVMLQTKFYLPESISEKLAVCTKILYIIYFSNPLWFSVTNFHVCLYHTCLRFSYLCKFLEAVVVQRDNSYLQLLTMHFRALYVWTYVPLLLWACNLSLTTEKISRNSKYWKGWCLLFCPAFHQKLYITAG
jgi:hypothetical protein